MADRYSLKGIATKRGVPHLYRLVREYFPVGIGVFEGGGRGTHPEEEKYFDWSKVGNNPGGLPRKQQRSVGNNYSRRAVDIF